MRASSPLATSGFSASTETTRNSHEGSAGPTRSRVPSTEHDISKPHQCIRSRRASGGVANLPSLSTGGARRRSLSNSSYDEPTLAHSLKAGD